MEETKETVEEVKNHEKADDSKFNEINNRLEKLNSRIDNVLLNLTNREEPVEEKKNIIGELKY